MKEILMPVLHDILGMTPYLFEASIIGLAALIFLPIYYKRSKNLKVTFKFCFWLYLLLTYLGVVWRIVFLSREMGGADRIDLLPFESWKYCSGNMIIIYVLENILLFVPIGFLLPCTFPFCRRISRTVLLGFCLSVMIEVVQFVTKTGFLQTDDVINNTIGAVTGYLIYSLIKNILSRIVHNKSGSH